MTLQDYLAVFRRRWLVIVSLGVLGAVVGLLLPPPTPSSEVSPWRATSVLVPTATEEGAIVGDVGLLAVSDEVLVDVAEQIGFAGDPTDLIPRFTVDSDEGGLVRVSAFAQEEEEAAAFSNAMAQALSERAVTDVEELRNSQVATLENEFTRIEDELAAVRAELGDGDDPILTARRNALTASLEQTTERLTRLQTTPIDPPLSLLQPAVAIQEDVDALISLPSGRPARALVLGAFGVLLGLASALVIERLDHRLRTPRDVERAYRLPVLATTPPIREGLVDGLPSTARDPYSPGADSIDRLRTALLVTTPSIPVATRRTGKHAQSDDREPGYRELGVGSIVLSSSQPGVGVTTTIENLAAAFSHSGMTVLVIDADQRTQTLSRAFGIERQEGLSDLLLQPSVTPEHVARTSKPVAHLPGVRVLPAGTSTITRGADPTKVRQLVKASAQVAQVVLVDTPDLTSSGVALEFGQFAEGFVVLSRLGRDTEASAKRVSDLLARSGCTGLGVVAVSRPILKRSRRRPVGDVAVGRAESTERDGVESTEPEPSRR